MANKKSSIARIRTNERNRQRNMAVKSRMKTYVKQAVEAIDAKDKDKVGKALPAALAEIDKAASKGVIHANTAGRKKSFLQRRAGTLS
ncbi:MAG: 30S ribosomal protein S20 [Candidatus Hydrogenedentes bacterium]|nr:30S ribosomal protein S20 [Candidatus Hydrogenedentota bacterium]